MTTLTEQRRLAKISKRLAEKALELIDSLDEETIASAGLQQRASALGSVIDRLIKLSDMAESAYGAGKVVHIEYRDPDGSIHQTPYWARSDRADPDSLQGRGMWAAVWQDRVGENAGD